MCYNNNIRINNYTKIFFITSIICNLSILLQTIFGHNIDELESIYINTFKKLWKSYPILDISLTKKNGYEKIILLNLEGKNICDCLLVSDYKRIFEDNCNEYKISKGCIEYMPNKASKIFETKLYAKYYKVDYLNLLLRLTKDNHICKNGYKRCGYLDDSNNTLCVKEEEKCPINYLHFDFDFTGNKTSITKITTNNERKDLPIIIKLLISDNKKATIFDINFLEIHKLNKNIHIPFDIEEKYKLISFDENFPIINKNKFFIDNNLVRGELKSIENASPLYLFRLNYPGKNEKYMNFHLFHYNILIKIIYFILRCCLFRIINAKNRNILNMIIFIIYSIFMLLNGFFINGKINLNDMLQLNSDLLTAEGFCFILDLIIFYQVIKIILNAKSKDEDKDKDKKRY